MEFIWEIVNRQDKPMGEKSRILQKRLDNKVRKSKFGWI